MAADGADGWEAAGPQDEPEDEPERAARSASEDWPEAGWGGRGPEGPENGEGGRGPEGLAHDAAFAGLLRALRTLPGPCAPPVGAGAFDILYASEREVVVWYQPARDGVEQREVTIPGALLRAAWALALEGAPVEEAALRALATGAAGGRWLLALLAQVPGVETRREGGRGPEGAAHGVGEDEPRVTLIWRGVDLAPDASPETRGEREAS